MKRGVLSLIIFIAVCLLLFMVVFNSESDISNSENSIEITGNIDDGFSQIKENRVATKNKIGNFAIILILSVLIILALSDNFSIKARKHNYKKTSDSKNKLRLKFIVYKSFIAYINTIANRKKSVDISHLLTIELIENLNLILKNWEENKIKLVIRDIEVDKIHLENYSNISGNKIQHFTANIVCRILAFKMKETTNEILENQAKKHIKILVNVDFIEQDNELKMNTINFNPTII